MVVKKPFKLHVPQVFLTTTSLIAIVTVIFCGGATQPLLKALHIPVSPDEVFLDISVQWW